MTDGYARLLDALCAADDPLQRAALLGRLGGDTITLERGAGETVELLSRAARRVRGGGEPYVRLLLGLALHARYRATGVPGDLDAGTAALADSIDRVPFQAPWRCFAAADLVNGLRLRAADATPDGAGDAAADRGGGDTVGGAGGAALDQAVERGEQELAHYDAERSAAVPLIVNLALAYTDRWRATGRTGDADRAIDLWRTYFEADEPMPPDEAGFARAFGHLLLERAYRSGDPADAEEAANLLEVAVAAVGGESGPVWYDLGTAYQAWWELGRADRLGDAFDCYTAALAAGLEGDPALDARLRSVTVAAYLHIDDAGDLDVETLRGLVEDCRRLLPAGGAPGPAQARAATLLAVVDGLLLSPGQGSEGIERVRRLLDLAAGGELEPRYRGIAGLVRDQVDSWAGDARPGRVRDDALRLLLTGGPHLPARQEEIAAGVASMLFERSSRHGDRRGVDAAVRMMRELADRGTTGDIAGRVLTITLVALHRAQDGDMAAFAGELRRAAALAASDASVDPDLVRTVGVLHQLSEAAGRTLAEPPRLEPLPAGAPDGPEAWRFRLILLEVMFIFARYFEDLPGLRDIAGHAAALLAGGAPGLVARRTALLQVAARAEFESAGDAPALVARRTALLQVAARAELEVAGLDPDDRAAARRAAGRFEELGARAGGPEHPGWPSLAHDHALALRRAGEPGDRAGSRRLGRSAVHAQAWHVLLQSGTDYAMRAAASTLDVVGDVAGWCIEDAATDPAALDDLIAVLDLGRGQVLRAATVSRGIADELIAAGHEQLAAEWRATAEPPEAAGKDAHGAAGEDAHGPSGEDAHGAARARLADVPDALRLRVMHALHPDGAERSALLAPAAAADIRTALEHVGADAFAYLVEGHAVVVSTVDGTEVLALPDLKAEPVLMLRELIAGPGAGRELEPVGGDDGSPVDLLCAWAWVAAMGPLLAHAGRWSPGRPPRIVLVPTGPFGLVPWHGAFDPAGDPRRYAIQDAVLSYAVSAATFCASARHPPRRPRATLVVGDPGLPYAAAEARAVHHAFHPDGAYLEPATPGAVLDWFAARDDVPAAAHFACHGRIDPARPADAELVLAGGALSVRRLIAASRHRQLRLEQVVLAACGTAVTGDDHDEAVSIATTFLAAGARTVFGALWPVPDAATALLMFMLHHFRAGEGLAPADALRAAQLWMLDPRREPPSAMPPALAAHAADPGLAAPPAWAAFTHLGR